MSFTMIISSKLAPGTMLATGVGSTPTPEKISSYISATRRGVSRTPSRSGSSPIPSRIKRTPSSTFLRSTSFTAIPTLPGHQPVQRVGQVSEVRELGGARKLGALTEPVDPHSRQAEFPARRDVVEQRRRDVRMVRAIHPRLLEEPIPVAVRRLVRARFGGGDAKVHRNADQLKGGVEHVGVGVREDRQPPSTLPQRRERPRHLGE